MACKTVRRTITTTGVDEQFAGLGGDPWGGFTNIGLRVPPAPTSGLSGRYFFLLATCFVPDEGESRLAALRLLLGIGADIGTTVSRVVEQPVVTPGFHFQDGNATFHLSVLKKQPKDYVGQVNTANLASQGLSLAYRMSSGPALLYESIAPVFGSTAISPIYSAYTGTVTTGITAYTPPNGGRPHDDGFDGYSVIYDATQYPWSQGTEDNIDAPLIPGTTLAVYASVRQTNPSTRLAYSPPATFFPLGLSPEEQFILNNTTGGGLLQPMYWRVGATITIETQTPL